jgi:IMP cyclohydrolase
MIQNINFLQNLRYPGRFIILGEDNDYFVAIYAAMGRNTSSLNRRYIQSEYNVIAEQLGEGGDEEILNYTAFRVVDNSIIIANGRQGEMINPILHQDATDQLDYDLSIINPEPDKYHTPRITGYYTEYNDSSYAGLHIVRKKNEIIQRQSWDIPLIPGQGKYIATYSGEDIRPTPSFEGYPINILCNFGSAENAVETIFNLLKPQHSDFPDYRVSVIAYYKKFGEIPIISIKNKI